MGNKKVLLIRPASAFGRYVRARDGMLMIAVYTERLFPFSVQMLYSEILRLMKNWSLLGVYSDDSSSDRNKKDFKKLLKLCERRKVDMIMCSSLEYQSEKTGNAT